MISAKSCLTIGRPLDGIVAVIDEDGLKPCSLELKMSIERLGGWVCHTVERCTLIILPPNHKQSDDGRRLRVSAQRLNKPIVGVEWVWATIDTMERPLLVEFPPDYEEKYGAPYVRCKKVRIYRTKIGVDIFFDNIHITRKDKTSFIGMSLQENTIGLVPMRTF